MIYLDWYKLIDWKIIFIVKFVLELKISKFRKKVNDIRKKDIIVLIAAEAIGSAPLSKIGFIIINPMDWHKAAHIAKITPMLKDPSIVSHLWLEDFLSP